MMPEKMYRLMIRLTRPLLIGVVATPLFAALDVAPDSSDAAPVSSSVITGQLARKLELIRALRTQLDRSQFELEALIDALDFEADQFIGFVRAEIVFQQYPGAMRGATGTLLSRAGNALDQALLLASLLKDAGYDARIVRGTLSREQATALLGEIDTADPVTLSAHEVHQVIDTAEAMNRIDGTGSADLSESYDTFANTSEPIENSETYGAVKDHARQIADVLATAGIELDPAGSTRDNLIEEARDYFWVEYKKQTSGPWIAVHPAASTASSDLFEVPSEQVYADTIPEELHQTIVVSAKVIQSIGGRQVEHQIMSPWKRPVANLQDRSLTFTNTPLNLLTADDLSSVDEMIRSAEAFVPVFNGSLAGGAQVFDLAGRVVPPDAASSPAAQMFRTMSDKTISAIDALSNLSTDGSGDPDSGDEAGAVRLEAMFLEIEVRVPGRPAQTYQASVYDRSNMPNAPKESINRRLNAQLTLGVSTGSKPEGYLLDQTLTRLESAWPFIELLFQRANNPGQPNEVAPDKLRNYPADWPGFPELFQSFSEAPTAAPALDHYFDRPVIAVHSTALEDSGILTTRIDIKSNSRRVLSHEGREIVFEPGANLELGVWDTHVEQLLVSDTPVFTAPQYMAASRQKDIDLIAVTERSVSQIESLPLADKVKAHLRSEINRGYAIVMPSHPIPDRGDVFAWWRVDPITGTTLGILHDATGGAQAILPLSTSVTEWLIKQLIGVMVSGAFAYGNYRRCLAGGGDAICCRDKAVFYFSVGAIIGGAAGASMLYGMTFKQFLMAKVLIGIGLTAYDTFALPDELTSCR